MHHPLWCTHHHAISGATLQALAWPAGSGPHLLIVHQLDHTGPAQLDGLPQLQQRGGVSAWTLKEPAVLAQGLGNRVASDTCEPSVGVAVQGGKRSTECEWCLAQASQETRLFP